MIQAGLKKIRVPDLALMKERGERIVMLTAYDATTARLLDRAGIDLFLVGDSLGNVILGLDTTICATPQYAQLGEQILNAVSHYAEDIRQGVFPPTAAVRRDRAPVHKSAMAL